MNNDTIAAIATASGQGGIGIVRISGEKAKQIAKAITGGELKNRYAHYTTFKNQQKQTIDEGIALYFKAPASFTGEDVVELQGHGGVIALDVLLNEVIQLGARMARPGEFSERAFLNDKIDLVQAEAVADIIECHSETALRSSLKSLSGEFSKKINQLIEDVTQLRIYVEAAIDFPDEEVDLVSDQFIHNSLNQLHSAILTIFKQAKSGSILNKGLSLAIVGKPNAGKSSLLNSFAAEDVAIVTEQAGTTRDIIKQNILLDDIPITFIDTAGLRKSDDIIEQEGIKRIQQIAASADIILYLRDASKEGLSFEPSTLNHLLNEHHITIDEQALRLVVNNKIDLINQQASIEQLDKTTVVSISAKQKIGLDLLSQTIKKHFEISQNNENSFTARRRHLNQLEKTLMAIEQGQKQLTTYQAGELLAEDLRQAQNELGEITGKISSDDLLGEIFSSFCIGK